MSPLDLKKVLWISILASFIAFLDGSVVNVALPAITRDFGGGLALQQWIVDAYLITLGALILIAGSFSDIYGRKRVLRIGLVGFGIASLLCAIASSGMFLIICRALQGLAGALLVPSSLAIIMSAFPKNEQAKAIGSWTAWTSVAFIVGPLVGGFLVDISSWRYVFVINVVPILIALLLLRHLKVQDKETNTPLDGVGAILASVGLGGIVYSLIEQPLLGWNNLIIVFSALMGVIAIVLFVWRESRIKNPMMPLSLFRYRNFAMGNLATLAIYAGISVSTFVIVIFVQQVGNFSATAAGFVIVPEMILLLLLSNRFGALSDKYGPRLFMTFGPAISGIGLLTMLAVKEPVKFINILPGVIIFGLGLAVTVAPLTAAILSPIKKRYMGIASAINNAAARIAGLIAIAAIGTVVGEQITLNSFRHALVFMAVLFFIGSAISAIGIENKVVSRSR